MERIRRRYNVPAKRGARVCYTGNDKIVRPASGTLTKETK